MIRNVGGACSTFFTYISYLSTAHCMRLNVLITNFQHKKRQAGISNTKTSVVSADIIREKVN